MPRSFITAEELTKMVQEQNPSLEEYRGVSDHTPNAQEIWFQGQRFVLVTFNILAPRTVPYINLIPFDGGALPHWIKCAEDQFGLEKTAFARPYRQPDREGAIMDAIESLFKRNQRVILCLQECDAGFHRKLSELGLPVYPPRLTKKDECVTVWSRDFEEVEPPREPFPAPFRLFGNKLHLFNVHLSFNTRQARADLTAMIRRASADSESRVPCLFVGDFNIPVMPQSEKVFAEKDSCTSDLIGTDYWLKSEFNVRPGFAPSALKFTNFVPRMNCEDSNRSWDHMDNIMMLDFPLCGDYQHVPLNWSVNLF